MPRYQRVIVWAMVSVLTTVTLPYILWAQEGERLTDFRNRDSYTDEELATALFPLEMGTRQVNRDVSQPQQNGVALKVFFETNSANIMPQYFPDLDKLGRVLTLLQYSETRLLIAGYTDNVGSDTYNLALAERRAASIKQYLVQKFSNIAPERLTVKGYGKANPIEDNSTPEGRAKNRRIVVTSLE